MSSALVQPDSLESPTGTFENDGGDGLVILTFPQDMDQTSTPAAESFLFRDVNSQERVGQYNNWNGDREMLVQLNSCSYVSDPLYLDYLNLDGTLKTLAGEPYEAWNDVILTDIT